MIFTSVVFLRGKNWVSNISISEQLSNGDEYQPMGLPLYLPAQDQGHLTTRIIDVRCENPIPDDTPELTPFEDILWKNMLKMSSVPLRSRIYVRLLFKKTSEAIFHRTALILKMLSNLQ
jgi:hypothetical protein